MELLSVMCLRRTGAQWNNVDSEQVLVLEFQMGLIEIKP